MRVTIPILRSAALSAALSAACLVAAAGPGRAQLASSAWPMFHASADHQGHANVTALASPSVAFMFQTGDSLFSSSPAIGADGTIYAGSMDRRLYAIWPNGTLRWSYPTNGPLQYSTPAVGSDGTIYVGSMDSTFYAVNPNGTLRWSFRGGSTFRSSPAIAMDGTVYVGCGDNNVYAFFPQGGVKWTRPTLGNVRSSPAVGPDGTVYAGSDDGKLYALNPADGTVKWTVSLGGGFDYGSATVGPDSTIYIGSVDGIFYAVRPTPALKWSRSMSGHSSYGAPAILPNGNIAFTFGSDITVVTPSNSKVWEFVATDFIRCSPAVASDGTLFFASDNDTLYAYTATGSRQWAYRAGNGMRTSPALVNGALYVGAFDGKLYGLGSVATAVRPPASGGSIIGSVRPAAGGLDVALNVPEAGDVAVSFVRADGRLVRTLALGRQEAGSRALHWDGRDAGGRPAATGLVFVVARVNGITGCRRAVLVR